MKSSFVLVIWLFPAVLFAQISEDKRNNLDAYITELIGPGDPGGAVGVVIDGQIAYERYFGLASLEHQVPISDSTVFNIASVAKQFTALCVLKLALEGKLSLAEDFREYLPNFYPSIADTIRIRHLINHSSGIRDVYDLLSIKGDPWWRKEGFSNRQALEILSKQKELNFDPGTDYLYSNSNYLLLTALVEKASGASFHEFSKQVFLELGMENTHFQKRYMPVIANQAWPYADWGDGTWQKWPMMTNLYGDGFLFTTLKDQLAYEQQVQHATGGLLLHSQEAIEDAEITTYGFGLELSDQQEGRMILHRGSTGSYHAYTVRYPDQKISIMVMGNNGRLWSEHIADKVESILSIRRRETSESAAVSSSKYDQEKASSDLAGVYASPDGKIRRILVEDGLVFWKQDNNQPILLSCVGGSLYQADYDEEVKVGFEAAGLTLYLPGSEPTFYKLLPPFAYTMNYCNDLAGTYQNGELDLEVRVIMDSTGHLQVHLEGRNRRLDLEIIHEDRFLAANYIVRPQRDELDYTEALLLSYSRIKNLKFDKISAGESRLKKYVAGTGSIQLSTTSKTHGLGNGDLLLTKNRPNGDEQWFKSFGGAGYEIAGAVELASDGGYLIVGATSSFGQGNYDAWVIKVDEEGEKEWSQTFGKKGNEYGVGIKEIENGYLLQIREGDLDGKKKLMKIADPK